MNVDKITINSYKKELEKGELSDLIEGYLERAKAKNEDLKALLEITGDKALEKTKEVTGEGELAGLPVVIKDNILVEGTLSTGGSKILERYRAPYDATVIKDLKEEEAIVIGKGNMDEFAMGGSTENSAYHPTKNPWDLERVPGGSSGGVAAAVASGMAPIGLGSDTGGSVRQPAAFCGIVGFKPSYGRVSRWGLMAMASSLDQIGPMTNSVEDARKVFDIIKGKDDRDATSVEVEENSEIPETIKVGVPKEYFVEEGVSGKVRKKIKEAISKLESRESIETVDISLPHTEYALACYHVIMDSEVSANMARYDGIRYGLEKDRPEADSIKEAYLKNRGKLGQEVKRRIILGTFALSSGYYEAYYQKAQKVRKLIKEDFEEAFVGVDVIASPTSPVQPFKIGEKIDDPLSMYLADTFTVPANLAGIPAISIPAGKVDGLPVGLQLMGDRFTDEKLLRVAEKFEGII